MLDVEYIASQGLSPFAHELDYINRWHRIMHVQDGSRGACGNWKIWQRSLESHNIVFLKHRFTLQSAPKLL